MAHVFHAYVNLGGQASVAIAEVRGKPP